MTTARARVVRAARRAGLDPASARTLAARHRPPGDWHRWDGVRVWCCDGAWLVTWRWAVEVAPDPF